MQERIRNILSDPNVSFWLIATPELKRLIVDNNHPYIVGLGKNAKSNLLDGKASPIAREDVVAFVEGTLPEREAFLLKTGDIRVGGAASVVIKNEQGK
jgi:hypothetical protein